MSHILMIRTQVRNPSAVKAACQRLCLPEPVQGTAQLFAGAVAGLLVQLPGWRYPAVIDLGSGDVKFDDYAGQWGERRYLDAFLQAYAVELCRLEAHKKGLTVSEQQLADGSIRVQIQEGT